MTVTARRHTRALREEVAQPFEEPLDHALQCALLPRRLPVELGAAQDGVQTAALCVTV